MLRSVLIPVVALVRVLAPPVVQAQYAVSPCGDGCARVSVIPAPPVVAPAPSKLAGEGWMSGFIKGVK